MRMSKWLCFLALCAPVALVTSGCGGSDEAGAMATDSELEQYGKEAAAGTALDGMSMKGGKKSE